MTFRYGYSKPDATTQQIVDELRALGFTVHHIGRPVDLAVTHGSWPANTWRFIECKSPQGKAKRLKLRKDQAQQTAYCEQHGIPYVLSGEDAIRYLTTEGRP